jgi:hypothetical protein
VSPSDSVAFDAAAEEHRRVVATCAAAIRSIGAADWERPPAERKWTPAEIAEHLAIAYDPVLAEVAGTGGFRLVVPWWKRRILRWKFLAKILEGTFPPGVPAPREVRPTTTARTPEEGARRLAEHAEIFLDRFAQAHRQGGARVTHPYIGRLDGVVAVRFLTAHVRHHRRQLPTGDGEAPGSAISSRHDSTTQGK